MVSAGRLRLGEGCAADPAGPGQPARHAVDGHLGAVRRHPRHARRSLDRLLRLARVHQDADPAGRVAVHPGRRGNAGLHRRRVTGRAEGRRAGRSRSPPSPACSRCSSGSSRSATTGAPRTRSPRARIPPRRPSRSSRLDAAGGELSLATLKGKPVVVNFWASWCIPCKDEAPALQTTYEKYKQQGLVVARDRRAGLPPGRTPVPEALRRHATPSSTTARARRSASGASPASPRRSSSIGRAGSSASGSREASTPSATRTRYAEGVRLALGGSP